MRFFTECRYEGSRLSTSLAPFIPKLSLEVMDGLAPVLQTETETIQFRATDEKFCVLIKSFVIEIKSGNTK